MDDIEKLKKAVVQTGFSLEWRAASIFQELTPHVEQNKPYTRRSSFGDSIGPLNEIDIVAEFNHIHNHYTYLVECKGSEKNNVLMLVESPKSDQSYPTLGFIEKGVRLLFRENIHTWASHGPYHCHTGDFFCDQGGEYKKASKQDDRSNLYKGVSQLIEEIDSYFQDWCLRY